MLLWLGKQMLEPFTPNCVKNNHKVYQSCCCHFAERKAHEAEVQAKGDVELKAPGHGSNWAKPHLLSGLSHVSVSKLKYNLKPSLIAWAMCHLSPSIRGSELIHQHRTVVVCVHHLHTQRLITNNNKFTQLQEYANIYLVYSVSGRL